MQEAVQTQPHEGRTILGVQVQNLGRDQAIALLDEIAARGGEARVSFANAQMLNAAYDNGRFRRALRRFIVLNDGLGTDIASRIKFGEPFTDNLNGTDFIPDFLRKTRQRLRIYLVGSTDSVAMRAAEVLRRTYPQHTIVGHRNGFFLGPHDVEQTTCNIQKSGATCVIAGMGAPLQELWIDEHGDQTGARLFFGVGALLDFQAGQVRRAPLWVRKARCEWVFRLAQEPQRLARRYLIGNFVFLGRVLADANR